MNEFNYNVGSVNMAKIETIKNKIETTKNKIETINNKVDINNNKVDINNNKVDTINNKNEETTDKKKSRAYTVLDISVTLCGIYALNIYEGKVGKEKYLLIYCFITVLTYYLARFSKIKNLLNIFHVLLAFGLVLTSICSDDKDVLIFLIGQSLLITASRKIFNGCIVRDIEKKDNELTSNSFTKMLKWDYIFPSLGLIGLYKLNNIKENTK